MKKVNFKNLKVPVGIRGLREGNFMGIDMAESVGDLMYARTSGIKYKRLAEKIFDSKDEIELDDEEIQLLNNFLAMNLLFSNVQDAIELMLTD